MANYKNISLQLISKFLLSEGFEYSHDKGGHKIYKKKGLPRSVSIQSHVSPVPPHILGQICRLLEITSKTLCEKIDAL